MPSQSPLILHIPHASMHIPAEVREQFCLNDAELSHEQLMMIDMFTDDLFQLENAARLEAPVSRLVVDMERFADPAQEDMEKAGMGAVYTKRHNGQPLRHPPPPEAREALLAAYYTPHHARLTNAVENALKQHEKAIIIDCHSFPSQQLPYERAAKSGKRPPIVLGTDPFHTPEPLLAELKEGFEALGYEVGVNDPFGGSLVPMGYYGTDKRVQSIMIELRRDLYMDETTGEKTANYATLKSHVEQALARVSNVSEA